jgi:hypothetical protein
MLDRRKQKYFNISVTFFKDEEAQNPAIDECR